MAATIPGASTVGLSEENKSVFNKVLGLLPERNSKALYAIFKADKLSRFYVPAVMLGHESPAPSSSRTVHILGDDQKSKFMSHALHGVYDSVQMVGMPPNSPYRNVTGNVGGRKHHGVWIESNEAMKDGPESKDENGHISNLVVGGRPSEAVKLLEKVKDRVDDRTAICYMQDGLGIAEDVNNKVFIDPEKRPSIMLGHISSSLAYNRETNSVRVMDPEYTTSLTGVRPVSYDPSKDPNTKSWQRTQGMLEMFAASGILNGQGVHLDKWMARKIQSLIFLAAVEPICVVLDAHYKDLLHNPTAHRLIDQLLTEIADVVGLMHETRRSPALQQSLRGERMRKLILSKIRGKKDAPCMMSLQIQRGLLTDINYLNGFFIQRGRRKGLEMAANQMVTDIVKAKHKASLEKLRSYIPLDMVSRL